MTTLDLDALERAARAAKEPYELDVMLSSLRREAARYEDVGAVAKDAILSYAADHLRRFPLSTILALISEVRALQERVEGAEKALRPFAKAADECIDDDDVGANHIWEHPAAMAISIDDLRRARALLSETGGE